MEGERKRMGGAGEGEVVRRYREREGGERWVREGKELIT